MVSNKVDVMFQPFNLAGKVALVTGGSGGLGFGMAEALAQAGAGVVLWDCAIDVAASARRLRDHDVLAMGSQVDVTDEGQVADAMSAAVEQMGRVDVVIAAAGISGDGAPFRETTLEAWRRIQAVNLDGVFLTFREALRHMVARADIGDPGGSLIGIASMAALNGASHNQAYSASKAAIIGLMRSLSVEHARFGIRANTIAPGWIATNMTRDMQQNPVVAQKVIPRIPMRRWGQPSDFGGLAVYLASDASAYHSGDLFVVDGGYLAF